jgi:hypothetical protein
VAYNADDSLHVLCSFQIERGSKEPTHPSRLPWWASRMDIEKDFHSRVRDKINMCVSFLLRIAYVEDYRKEYQPRERISSHTFGTFTEVY